jgi:hypothetical protein
MEGFGKMAAVLLAVWIAGLIGWGLFLSFRNGTLF